MSESGTHSVDILYGLVCFTCVLVGAPGNLYALYYFLTQKRDVGSIVHIGVTLVDFLICLTPLPVGISYMRNRQAVLFGNVVFCNVHMTSFLVLYTLSLFYRCLLTITRSYSILRPFSQIVSKALVKGVMLVCLLATLLINSIVFWESGSRRSYSNLTVACASFVGGTHKYLAQYNALNVITTCLIPLLILISCIMSIYALKKTSEITASMGNDKRYAAVTIAMFTFLFVIFNMPGIIVALIVIVHSDAIAVGDMFNFDTYFFFRNYLFYLSFVINSMCNPILYIVRMKRMREGAKRFIRCNKPPVSDRASGLQRQQSDFHTRISAVGTPLVSTVGNARISTVGNPRISTVGTPRVSAIGTPQVSAIGTPQVSAIGTPQISTVGTPQISAIGTPQICEVGTPQICEVGTPQISADIDKDEGIRDCAI